MGEKHPVVSPKVIGYKKNIPGKRKSNIQHVKSIVFS